MGLFLLTAQRQSLTMGTGMVTQRLDRRLYGDKTAMERLGLSRSAFYRYLQKRAISQPVGRIGKNRRGWTDQDIELAKSELNQVKEKK